MSRKTYFKQWRHKRDLTQDQVIDRLSEIDDPHIPRTTASLSRIENGKQPYNQRILEALADVYGCDPEELIGRDPSKDSKAIDLVRGQDERRQAQIIAFIKALDDQDGAPR